MTEQEYKIMKRKNSTYIIIIWRLESYEKEWIRHDTIIVECEDAKKAFDKAFDIRDELEWRRTFLAGSIIQHRADFKVGRIVKCAN